MPENNDTNEYEIIDKIKVLNVKKGDVLIVRYKALPPEGHSMPQHIWTEMTQKQIKKLKEFIHKNWSGRIGLISIPDTIDIEILRLEEWFV
jgi:hypothetical protein